MTPENFCYWLQGFVEMMNPKEMTEAQTTMLKKHLALVFVNVTNEPDVVSTDTVRAEPQIPTDEAAKDIGKKIQDHLEKRERSFWEGRPTVTTCDTSFCSSLGRSGGRIC